MMNLFSLINDRSGGLIALLLGITFFIALITSCNKNEDYSETELSKDLTVEGILYHGIDTFFSSSGKVVTEIRELSGVNLNYLENLTLKVQNGNSNATMVSQFEIKIDGEIVLSSGDFTKKTNMISKEITGLTRSSVLEVTLDKTKDGFITMLIQGVLIDGVISDIDGHLYKTVKIGDNVWMAENLRTSHYNDGTPITHITDNAIWSSTLQRIDEYTTAPYIVQGAYSWYNNDNTFENPYGKLYNFGAVETGRLCPVGWHVPSSTEFYDLFDSYKVKDPNNPMDSYGIIGNELIEAGSSHWIDPIGTNETGFTALPGGSRGSTGIFFGLGHQSAYWSSTGNHPDLYTGSGMSFFLPWEQSTTPTMMYRSLEDGYSIRCLKNSGKYFALKIQYTDKNGIAKFGILGGGEKLFQGDWCSIMGANRGSNNLVSSSNENIGYVDIIKESDHFSVRIHFSSDQEGAVVNRSYLFYGTLEELDSYVDKSCESCKGCPQYTLFPYPGQASANQASFNVPL